MHENKINNGVCVLSSVADRFVHEPCGGSNSKEKLQTAEGETANNYKTKQES